MKKSTTSLTQNFKKLGVLALLSIGALAIQSCSKDPGPAPEYAFLNIINTNPTPATYNIFVDQTKINSQAVPFGGNSGYMTVTPGGHKIKFTTASSNNAVIEKDVSLDVNSVTSLFLIDKEANMDILTIKDELGDMNSSKAFVRFINLSPNAPELNLAVKDGEVIVSDKAYKAVSPFVEVEAKAYVFQLKDKALGTPMLGGDLESIELKAGRSYTIISRGLVGASDVERPFSGQIIAN